MNFVKKIFDGYTDGGVHLQFQRFGKGEFKDRAIVKATQSKGRYNISTTYEFANELVGVVADKLRDKKTRVTGVIISTTDLTKEVNFREKKQFQGVKKYLIDFEMSGKEISGLLEKFPGVFFALSFKSDDTEIKIKPKMPKSGKPSKKAEGAPKPDFCKLVTSDENIGKSFVFEKPDFKKAEIIHKFVIKEIIFPEGEKDYSKIREMAKRRGVIIRSATIDGNNIISEKDFTA